MSSVVVNGYSMIFTSLIPAPQSVRALEILTKTTAQKIVLFGWPLEKKWKDNIFSPDTVMLTNSELSLNHLCLWKHLLAVLFTSMLRTPRDFPFRSKFLTDPLCFC